MNDILIIVDMQYDFIEGSLGTKEARAIVPRVKERIRSHQGPIFYTLDTHDDDYLRSQEGHHLPVLHCQKNSDGWQVNAELLPLLRQKGAIPIEKNTFAAKDLTTRLTTLHNEKPLTSIILAGLCTDICVISNALMIKGFLPDVPIYVDAAACAGVNPKSHQTALDAMAACQIVVVNG